jgi:hypothetical protein
LARPDLFINAGMMTDARVGWHVPIRREIGNIAREYFVVHVAAMVASILGTVLVVATSSLVSAYAAPVDTVALPGYIGTLAVGPNGRLYIGDPNRNQILELMSTGEFEVVAGVGGAPGYSGDGRPAALARLNHPDAMVFSPNGTLYFVDSGNGRVREILPDGVIETVAGNGSGSYQVTKPTPALETGLGGVQSIAFGPGDDLYIGGDALSRLHDGVISYVMGNFLGGGCGPQATSFSYLDAIAFDRAGDLFASNANCYSLIEQTAKGIDRKVSTFRASGAVGLVDASSNGNVVGGSRAGIFRLSGTSMSPVSGFEPGWNTPGVLGKNPYGRSNIFIPDAVAIANNGDIYAATNVGNTFTSESAIIEITPAGKETLLWKS